MGDELHGDMLECVLLRLPPDDLTASAALVSSEWRRAARAVHHQRHRHRVLKLQAHIQSASLGRSTHVYDPRTRAWASDRKAAAHLQLLPVRRCACACLPGDRVYTLSLASLTISADALGTAWRELPPPRVWRVDPVVAAVGPRVVVLGGACGALASAGVVEVHDDEDHGWATCPPVPAPLARASGRCVSAAASGRRVYVVERRTGWASWFDPSARLWGPTRRLQQPRNVHVIVESWAVLGGDEHLLILAGTGRSSRSVKVGVVLWSVDGETLLQLEAEGATTMPAEMSEKLFGTSTDSVGVAAAGSGGCGYVYNASEPNTGAVMYDLQLPPREAAGVGGIKTRRISNSRWEWLPCPPAAGVAQAPSSLVLLCYYAPPPHVLCTVVST